MVKIRNAKISAALLTLPLLFLVCTLTTGCSLFVTTFDNHGGYAHTGQQLQLGPRGRYKMKIYTDKVGDGPTTTGQYKFDAGEWQLTLTPDKGEPLQLYRVDFAGGQYWVRAEDRVRIKQPNESLLRQNSLRLDSDTSSRWDD